MFWHPRVSLLKAIIRALKVMHDEKIGENEDFVSNGACEEPMIHQV